MTEGLLIANVVAVAAAVVLLIVLLRRRRDPIADAKLSELDTTLRSLVGAQERTERTIREEIANSRREGGEQAAQLRKEVGESVKGFGETIGNQMGQISALQRGQLESFAKRLTELTQLTERRLEGVRQTVEQRLNALREDNAAKLDKMRETVDEKLQSTLDRRLNESFTVVNEQLEKVYKGLGEMQKLATGVGDLKKVLTNVKTRGTWGEVQLGSLLEQILSPDQYARDLPTKKGSNKPVEFAIKLPGRESGEGDPVWLPIDAKFPLEDYQRLQEAQERGDVRAADEAVKQLVSSVLTSAKDINEKYISPPDTTDFGIMFLPTEGLYAEVIRRTGLLERLQRQYHVVVAGPTTLAALLNALQMGFRTLAIQKRSSEIWEVLGAVKTEFGKFGDVLDVVNRNLATASNSMRKAATRTRVLQKTLDDVEAMPAPDAQTVLGLDTSVEPEPATADDDVELGGDDEADRD